MRIERTLSLSSPRNQRPRNPPGRRGTQSNERTFYTLIMLKTAHFNHINIDLTLGKTLLRSSLCDHRFTLDIWAFSRIKEMYLSLRNCSDVKFQKLVFKHIFGPVKNLLCCMKPVIMYVSYSSSLFSNNVNCKMVC